MGSNITCCRQQDMILTEEKANTIDTVSNKEETDLQIIQNINNYDQKNGEDAANAKILIKEKNIVSHDLAPKDNIKYAKVSRLEDTRNYNYNYEFPGQEFNNGNYKFLGYPSSIPYNYNIEGIYGDVNYGINNGTNIIYYGNNDSYNGFTYNSNQIFNDGYYNNDIGNHIYGGVNQVYNNDVNYNYDFNSYNSYDYNQTYDINSNSSYEQPFENKSANDNYNDEVTNVYYF